MQFYYVLVIVSIIKFFQYNFQQIKVRQLTMTVGAFAKTSLQTGGIFWKKTAAVRLDVSNHVGCWETVLAVKDFYVKLLSSILLAYVVQLYAKIWEPLLTY